MKRLSAIILSALIFFSFYACSQDDHKSETTQSSSSNTSTTATERNGNEEDIETTPDESQMLAILDSVSTLIDVDILYDEEYHRCYNFINEVTGYFFQFKILGSENRLAYLLKTEDGGKTWAAQDIQTHSTMGWRERIICAKMLDEKVGLISGKFWADENFSDHTYITTDGGKIWTKIVLPKNSPYVNSERSSDLVTYLEGEAYDLTYEDGVYFLHVRASNYDPESDSQYYYLSYSSTDLTNWTFVETDNTELCKRRTIFKNCSIWI